MCETYLTEESALARIGAITGVSPSAPVGISCDANEYPTLGRGVLEIAEAIAASVESVASPAPVAEKFWKVKNAANAAVAPSAPKVFIGRLKANPRGFSTNLRIILAFNCLSNCDHWASVGRSHFLRARSSSSVGFLFGIVNLHSL